MAVSLFPQQRNGPTCRIVSLSTSADVCHWNCAIDLLSLLTQLRFLSESWTRFQMLLSLTYPCIHLCMLTVTFALPWTCVYLTVGMGILPAEWNVSVTTLVTTHTCSVTLMEMTELQDCLEVSVLSANSATWQRQPSRSKEVSLSICVNEVTTLQGQATTRMHNLHSSADNYYEKCKNIWVNHPWFFNQSDTLPSCMQRSLCTERRPWTRWWWPLKGSYVNWQKHPIRERRRQNSPVSHFIQYISRLLQSLLFSMEWPLWNTEWVREDKRTLDWCFLVPSAW